MNQDKKERDKKVQMTKLEFVQLRNPKRFTEFQTHFPVDALKSLEASYPNVFDNSRFRAELCAVYNSDQLQGKGAFDLNKTMHTLDLQTCFSEVNKLAALILTIPYSMATMKIYFSTLKRKKTFTWKTHASERLSPSETQETR
ncbi:UNVERIFIED_CONTAM: hypothetical protein FKN15_063316 [Acipenser sinensis]